MARELANLEPFYKGLNLTQRSLSSGLSDHPSYCHVEDWVLTYGFWREQQRGLRR
jgi:hypothetical protein